MRAFLTAAAALAVLTVSGCDINTGAQKPATVQCNCAVPPQAATTSPPDMRGSTAYTPPAVHRHHRGYDSRWAGRGHYWRRDFAEVSVITYDYHSDSHSYVLGGGDATGYGGGDGSYHAVEHGWIDGYGRGHSGGGATTGDAVHDGHGDHGRLHPWHGYDADCPDAARR